MKQAFQSTFAEWITQADRPALVSLIIANLLPLVGVVWFGWDAGGLVLLYWWENIATGAYAILRIALAAKCKPAEHLGKLFLIPFFCIHYGGFCAVHGVFLLALFTPDHSFHPMRGGFELPGPLMFISLLINVIAAAWRSQQEGAGLVLAALFVSHGISFVRHYLLRGEFRSVSPASQMGRPYGRIVLLHVCIIVGAFFVIILGSALPLLVLLVLLKTAIDVVLHCGAHQRHLQATVMSVSQQ